ncbi:hypothetical protein B0I35DRAFT_136518 [Stachybotrys elegans]|uniref:DH domain-containing protein n=1 Tax=Stachybotrys elegans TaxID=80388 RepID=A0A8K0T4T5_9HYPO|nr:hypothetical protein B0I35DRAFT_136518 [Stachybotrys elegans]
MALVESSSYSHHSSIHAHNPSWGPPYLRDKSPAPTTDGAYRDQVDMPSSAERLHLEKVEVLGASDDIESLAFDLLGEKHSHAAACTTVLEPTDNLDRTTPENEPPHGFDNSGAFHRWMRSLRHRAKKRPAIPACSFTDPWQQLPGAESLTRASSLAPTSHLRSSSSVSSFRFISAVRSASVSLASVSAVGRSRRNIIQSHGHSRTDRSSRASLQAPRFSEDSTTFESCGFADSAAVERSLQRRRILEELIDTEEGYIGDIRFLMSVYVTIMASLPTSSAGLRSSINRNLTEIIQLHEEILGDLHRVVPASEYTQADVLPLMTAPRQSGHRRWSSVDAVREHARATGWLQGVPGMVSEPQVSAEVSKIFARKMNRFFIYKEYGARYEIMMKDVSVARQVIPEWESYQKGLETLASASGSAKDSEGRARKALTISDLLVKPVQRICKYPLLFSELLKYTPVSDCPNSHMEIDSTLIRLREVTAEINRATDDTRMKAVLEKTWLLQDRLAFPSRKLDAASKNQIRSFGQVRLCGALHVCWQSKSAITGQYMICLLYRGILCLASAGKVDPVYTIQACINLHRTKVEDIDNGRGLQCHTAPFSWKLVFECNYQLYEIILTACTAKEEMEWRTRLSLPLKDDPEALLSFTFETIDMDIKSLGTVFGKPGTIARRISIQRATTVTPKSSLAQVVLKNTSVARDHAALSSSSSAIYRSQSLLTTNHRVPILAPPRSERARLEALLADVWSREVLPFPGMTARSRSEQLVRSSASTVMRKLSVASIASSFTKRSGSLSHKHKSNDEDARQSHKETSSTGEAGGQTKPEANEPVVEPMHSPDDDPIKCCEMILTPLVKADSVDFVTGTVRHMPRKAGVEVDGSGYILRTSSPNSIRVSQTNRSEKSSICSAEKENASKPSRHHSKISSRWGHGGSKGDGKSHGFRSLFR